MTYEVLAELKVKTAQGETILSPGQLIRLAPAKAKPLVESSKIRPTGIGMVIGVATLWKNSCQQETPEARHESLEAVMTALLIGTRNRIIEMHKGRQYKATDEARQVESAVDGTYHQVLSGLAEIADFSQAVAAWETLSRFRVSE